MATDHTLPSYAYKLMLFAATIVWGASFVFMKDAVEVLTPAQLVGIRFTLAGLLLLAIFWKRVRTILNAHGVIAGVIMGTILFLAFWTQTIGLANTTPGKNAFLTATYCVIVPFLAWIITRKPPGIGAIIAAVICVAGIGLVSLTGDSFNIGFGDCMTLLCALIFAIEILAITHFSKTLDVIAVTVLQFLFCGVLGLVFGFTLEPLPSIDAVTPGFILEMIYLITLASCVCYIFQNVGLAHVPSSQGALILSLESVFGVITSVLFYGEVLTLRMVIGFALIFIAILISELAPKPKT